MRVIKSLTYQDSGRVMEGPNKGDLVIRPVSEITITLKRREVEKLLVGLEALDLSKVNQATEMFVAKLKATL